MTEWLDYLQPFWPAILMRFTFLLLFGLFGRYSSSKWASLPRGGFLEKLYGSGAYDRYKEMGPIGCRAEGNTALCIILIYGTYFFIIDGLNIIPLSQNMWLAGLFSFLPAAALLRYGFLILAKRKFTGKEYLLERKPVRKTRL